MREDKVGTVSHYYPRIGVAAVTLNGELKVGDRIHIRGASSDFVQEVASIEKEHHWVPEAHPGEIVGVKVFGQSRPKDAVYKIVEEKDAA